MNNFQQYRHIAAPGWTLGWTWAKKEVIWTMMGGQTTEQEDCSKFKGNVSHCCKKNPTIVDLLPGTPYNRQIANCCKGGLLSSWAHDPTNAVASFQVSVCRAGTTNKTVKVPKNFTLNAPGPGYTCGPGKIVPPHQIHNIRQKDSNTSTHDMERNVYIFTISSSENSYKGLTPYGELNDTAMLWGMKFYNDFLNETGRLEIDFHF